MQTSDIVPADELRDELARIVSSIAFASSRRSQLVFAADEFPSASASELEEITVTAEFRRESLQQTALAITAFSAESLQAHGDSNIVDVGNRAPSVTLTPAPGVGIYVDDVYHGTLVGSMLDLLDLLDPDRVEVLRGPQGTLSGKTLIGGSIKLFSQAQTGEGGYVDVAFGEFNRVNVKASASFTVVPNILLVRVSGVTRCNSRLPQFGSPKSCLKAG
jgi:iron complex outermembrane receptor protein